MSPGRSGALHTWKGLDREPFRHRPGMFVTPTAAFPPVDESIVRVRLSVGRRHRLSYPGRRIILIHHYGQPDAIAAMVRCCFQPGTCVLPTDHRRSAHRSARRKTEDLATARLGGWLRPYVGTLEPAWLLSRPISRVLSLSLHTVERLDGRFTAISDNSKSPHPTHTRPSNISSSTIIATLSPSHTVGNAPVPDRERSRRPRPGRGAHQNPRRGRRVKHPQ